MLRERDGFICDMEVFQNSGNNLAEYLLKKKGKRMPGRLFQLNQNENDEEVSFKLIEERQRPSHPQNNLNNSSSSSSNVSFKRFMPATASTPFPPVTRPSCPRKVVSMPKSVGLQTIVRPEQSPKTYNGPNHRRSSTPSVQRSPTSHDTSLRQITVNNGIVSPSPGCPPYADVPAESQTSKTHTNIVDPENERVSLHQSSRLKVRDISQMQNKTKSRIAAESIHEKSKDASIAEKSSNEQREVCTSDDDDVIGAEVVQRNTIKEVQRMEISEPEKRSSTEISRKERRKTTTTAVTIDPQNSISICTSDDDEEEECTLIPQNTEHPQKDGTSMCDVRHPQKRDDVTSGFVDISTQSARTTTSKLRENVRSMATIQKSVIPEMPENNLTIPSLPNKQTELPLPSASASSITHESGIFKAPLATGQRIRRKRKIDSPLAKMIQLENTIRQSVPREIGTSRRKLYSKGSKEDSGESLVENIPNGSASQQQQQESAVEMEVDREIEENEDENAIRPCSVSINRVDLKETPLEKKQRKQKKDKKQKVVPEPMEEEGEEGETVTLRRSKRTRCAPTPFWLGAQCTPLTVKTYNEKVDIKKRYVKQGLNSTATVKGDYTILMEKKKKKKARPKHEKFYNTKKSKKPEESKQTEVVEPQLDAVQEDRLQSPKAANKKSKKNNNKRKERNQELAKIEVHEENVQLSKERDNGINEQDTQSERNSLVEERISSYSRELNSLPEAEQLLAAQVIDNESHSCQHLEKKTVIDGIHMFVVNSSERCGYFLFDPGTKKRVCRVTYEYLYLVVLKGTFLTRIDGYFRQIEKNNIIILKKGTKYELTYLMDNQDQGKLLFISSEY